MLVNSYLSPKGICRAYQRDGNIIGTNFVAYSNGRGYLTNYVKIKGTPWNNRPENRWWWLTPLNLIEWNEE